MSPPTTSPQVPDDLRALQKVTRVMDRAVRIPVLNIEVGLDALLGLVPGAGDAVAALVGFVAILEGLRHRVPPGVLVRIVGNILLDMGLGTVPVLGDVLDVFFRSNSRNLQLVLEHRDVTRPPRTPGAAAWVVLGAVGLLLVGALALAFSVLGLLWSALYAVVSAASV